MIKTLQKWLGNPQPTTLNPTESESFFKHARRVGLLLTALVVANLSAQAQATYQIGSGAATGTDFPINSCFAYNYSQQIYTASEIIATGVAGSQSISKLRFYYDGGGFGTANWANFTIYLGNTTQSNFATDSSWVPAASLTQVYDGSFSATAGTWIDLVLDSTFVWDGSSNLVVAIHEDAPGWSCTARFRSYTGQAATTAILYYSDDTNPNPLSPPAANETNQNNYSKPQIQLVMTSTVPCAGMPAPGNTIASANPACPNEPFTLTTQFPANGYGYTYQWQTSADSINWTNTGTGDPSMVASITADTWYRVIATCTLSGDSGVSAPVKVALSSFINCYCISSATSGGGVDIGRVEFGNLQNGTASPVTENPVANNMYSDFANLAPSTFYKGISYPLSLYTITAEEFLETAIYNVFIDYNHDGQFDGSDERVLSTHPFFFSNPIEASIQIPDSALTGNTRMRIVMTRFNIEGTNHTDPCGTYYQGETEDYIINIAPLPICSATPFPGSLPDSIGACLAGNLTITAANAEMGTGITYQWEQSVNGGASWTNVTDGSGATTASFTTDSLTASYAGRLYRLRVTCTISGLDSVSTPTALYIKSFQDCYCQPEYLLGTNDGDYIGRVSLGTIHNITTGASDPYYTFYSNLSTDLAVLASYNLTLSPGAYGSSSVQAAWIDYNQNGQFEASEKLGEITFAGPYPDSNSISFSVPIWALSGTTRMRVVHVYDGFEIEPCGSYDYGETEDYLVNITGISGNFSINDSLPTSNSNFNSFQDLATTLNSGGISGPLTVNVAPGTGPYTDKLLLEEIPGSSSTNTLTINGNGNTLTGCFGHFFGKRDMIRLDGTDNITINGFVLDGSMCGDAWGVHLMNGNENVTISNNTILHNAAYSIYAANHQGIIAANSFTATGAMAGILNNITITGNTIHNGYSAIRINGNSSDWANNLVISGNTLTGAAMHGIITSYTNNLTVDGNQLNLRNVNPTQDIHSIGMQISYAENGLAVRGNKVANSGKQALFLNYINEQGATRGTIANNMLGGGFRFSSPISLQLNFASYLDVYFNSLNTDFGTGIGLYVSNTKSRNLRVMNNSIAYTGASATGRAMSAAGGFVNFTQLDYNNYYSTGQFVVFNNAVRNNLAELQSSMEYGTITHDQNSVSIDPLYTSATDLHLSSATLSGMGTSINSITTDFDGQARPTPPSIGADEFTAPPRMAGTANQEISVYPNPFRNELSVELKEGKAVVVLVDMLGREVFRANVTSTGAPVTITPNQQIAEGVYILKVTQNGTTSQTRVVKQ